MRFEFQNRFEFAVGLFTLFNGIIMLNNYYFGEFIQILSGFLVTMLGCIFISWSIPNEPKRTNKKSKA